MSQPIKACLIARALKNAPHARERLKEKLEYNKRFGGFSIYPCECDPRCDSDIDDKDLPKLTMELIQEVPDFIGIIA